MQPRADWGPVESWGSSRRREKARERCPRGLGQTLDQPDAPWPQEAVVLGFELKPVFIVRLLCVFTSLVPNARVLEGGRTVIGHCDLSH